MIVKKKSLISICIVIAITSIVCCIVAIKYVKQGNKEKDKIIQEERYNRAVDREYKQLVLEYNDIVETIIDDEYSYDFRCRYVRKLNEFLGGDKCSLYPIKSNKYATVEIALIL